MPKAATASRNAAVPAPRAVRRSAGNGRTSAHVPAEGTRTRQGLGSRAQAGLDIQDDDFEVVHAPCNKVILQAEETNQQLTTRFNQQRRETQRLNAENARLAAQVRQLTAENQNAKSEIRHWKQKFDDATSEFRDHVPREEVQRMLREIHDDAVSFADRIGTRRNESENMHLFSALPGSNVTQSQDAWQGQQGQFNALHDPILPENVGSMFPTADGEALPEFGDYLNMPQD
ncbi:hypothetical protein N7492_008496 [Penicillium capsulatum]|uniref:Uncharacterized protein n=1 Tax=Penicillium capsulatum TaxID=69766 RepID=A0A9W9LFY6_9EURO|nr:hypothetical protein N7492_008469 [Penicillium capsulatum]KAJ5155693.1 hypothetical protein N7492_008496 [Penicillium capsulatum]KAJ6105870.1 hypothetical protein N7512_009387 [Penicillium capsulatum]KAJ6105898.1 hypothetical protein N7512_009415 [Penicillium capsulatum]